MPDYRTRDEPRLLEEDLLQGVDPRVFVTQPESPEVGRTFVWAWEEFLEQSPLYPEAPELSVQEPGSSR